MTEHAERMQAVVDSVAPLLRERGFRKQRHAFARETEPGLVQALDFQMGAHDPPGTVEIPGLRENVYGLFTINLGLWFVEASRASAPRFVRPSACQLMQRIGFLLDPPGDAWWPLDGAADVVAREAVAGVALPWLDRLATREAIVAAWNAHDRTVRDDAMVAPYTVALVLHALGGDPSGPLREQLRETIHPGALRRLVENAREQLGIDLTDEAAVQARRLGGEL
jgi:hypothetical protein